MPEMEVTRVSTLPRLAWAARVSPSAVTGVVGPWVEVGPDRLFEGAWNGDLWAGDFANSYSFTGSGLMLCDGEVVVVAPCSRTETVYAIHGRAGTWVSNSVALVLKVSGRRLDPDYLDYEADVLSRANGLSRYQPMLPLLDGAQLQVLYCCNARLLADGSFKREEKPRPGHLAKFADYRRFLSEELLGVHRNATDARRLRRYPPIVFCSNGYDSTACAALAREVGCDEAVVYESKRATRSDSGRRVVGSLGYGVIHEHEEEEYLGLDSAELFLGSGELGTAIFIAPSAQELAGKMLLSGYHGDQMWGRRPTGRDVEISVGSLLPGHARKEFRLSSGFLEMQPAMLTVQRIDDVVGISNSPEMRPWQLGNSYDRPIPRRIAEEAGVHRSAFGVVKDGGAGSSTRFGTLRLLRRSMPSASHERFSSWLRRDRPKRRARVRTAIRALPYFVYLVATYLDTRGKPLLHNLLRVSTWPVRYQCSPFAPSYLFLWAVEELQRTQYADVTVLDPMSPGGGSGTMH